MKQLKGDRLEHEEDQGHQAQNVRLSSNGMAYTLINDSNKAWEGGGEALE